MEPVDVLGKGCPARPCALDYPEHTPQLLQQGELAFQRPAVAPGHIIDPLGRTTQCPIARPREKYLTEHTFSTLGHATQCRIARPRENDLPEQTSSPLGHAAQNQIAR